MTTATQLRERIAAGPRYAHLARRPIDRHAIAEIRRCRQSDADYYAAINHSHNGEDEAYEKIREGAK